MKKEIREKFIEIGKTSGSGDQIEELARVLEMPDNQFDKIYPTFKGKLENLFSSKVFQQEILSTLETFPIEDFEGERRAVVELINEIKEDDTISVNKQDMLISILEQSVLAVYDLYKNPRERIEVKIQKIYEDAQIPTYAHDSDAGADVYAYEDTDIKPHETVLVKTGIKVAIPAGYEIQLRPRSGMSFRTPLRIANAPATIDADFRGEIMVIMWNSGNLTQNIKKGDRIAQMVISPVPMISWKEVNSLDTTERNEGGFGSSGE